MSVCLSFFLSTGKNEIDCIVECDDNKQFLYIYCKEWATTGGFHSILE